MRRCRAIASLIAFIAAAMHSPPKCSLGYTLAKDVVMAQARQAPARQSGCSLQPGCIVHRDDRSAARREREAYWRQAARQAAPGIQALPAEPTQARRFGKTRTAQSTALLEDYAELIADLLATAGEARPTDIARRLGVSHATAIKTIARLKREGLATAGPIAACS